MEYAAVSMFPDSKIRLAVARDALVHAGRVERAEVEWQRQRLPDPVPELRMVGEVVVGQWMHQHRQTRAEAQALQQRFFAAKDSGEIPALLFVGALRDRKVGPHPIPQFEIHFRADALTYVLLRIRGTGLTALVHPLTDDDLADHTSLALWIGEPLPLDETVLDPPGRNQGVARFGKSDV